ncbi:hypothetical protein NJB14197_04990 [Mycobacterium montefiorense]|uniref:Uncharacterized protein n=1 Tax=Mycobacterium montefiorense TaxID=154654 RepID=A0AA37UZK6_9MYCO|nr:hypothetical protein MmonteBS_37980 [Mycobacterium montefiorense]GKU33197.1 hypothetical protein NJB14191_05440 [Mycobacterium montefiorense]GKU42232.1 hypothetical protein NJB14192_42150 [Mycobacterium montefiorense]GKU44164.1 hypothetical protein NJB14194_07930 [Mycobacterium montefiorense]GKU53157.1 hypothetical protein NJB14195_43980 [Mycobacterium montefiorense]
MPENLHSFAQQGVRMLALRNTPAINRSLGQTVPLDDSNRVVEIGQCTCGKESTHARAQNDCSLPCFAHSRISLTSYACHMDTGKRIARIELEDLPWPWVETHCRAG